MSLMAANLALFFFFFFFFFLLSPLATSSPTRITITKTNTNTIEDDKKSAYDALAEFNFPQGLLPKGALGYELDQSTGRFKAFLNGSCSFSLEGSYDLKYKSTISGYISQNKLTALTGISVKILFLWLNIIEVGRDGDDLYFSVGIASASFPIDNFYECPQCGCGLNCGSQQYLVGLLGLVQMALGSILTTLREQELTYLSGHRCGAYHNASDDKVSNQEDNNRNVNKNDSGCDAVLFLFVPCIGVVRVLYTLGDYNRVNDSSLITSLVELLVLMHSHRFVQLVL